MIIITFNQMTLNTRMEMDRTHNLKLSDSDDLKIEIHLVDSR